MSHMTDRNKKGTTHENLLEILDNIIHQLDFTKKIVIIMILPFITIIPISAVVIGVLSVSDRDLGVAIPIIAVAVFLVWLGVGIRQWIVFSKWTQKYRVYKELQKKLDERLDFDQDKGTEEKQQ
jgi:type III secretory pathway component EscU